MGTPLTLMYSFLNEDILTNFSFNYAKIWQLMQKSNLKSEAKLKKYLAIYFKPTLSILNWNCQNCLSLLMDEPQRLFNNQFSLHEKD